MGYNSFDDFLNEYTVNGKAWRADWNKLTHAVGVQAAGEWHCLFHSTGNPTTGVLSGGTNKSFQSLCEQSAGAIWTGGPVAPDTKDIVFASAVTAAATTAPCVLMLVDLLGYYPESNVTTTGDQAVRHTDTFTANDGTDVITHAAYDIASYTRVQFTTTDTLPAGLSLLTDYWTIRQSATTSKVATSYANAVEGTFVDITSTGSGVHTVTTYLPRYTDGAGVFPLVVANTACGAGTPNYRVTYTAKGGATGHVTPATLPVGKASPIVGHVVYSGTGAGKYGPFMPLVAGDQGVLKLEQIYRSGTQTSGTQAWILAKRILTLPINTLGVLTERNCIVESPPPRIYDGACLAWLMYAGAATPVSSSLVGHLEFGWG